MADQFKATASHLYGNGFCQTPALAELAQRGTKFEVAITPQPLCVPARVAIWTSRWPHSSGARLNETPMPAGEEHAFRIWRRAGFTTALIGKDHCFAEDDDRALFDVRCAIGHDGLPADDEPRGMDWVISRQAIAAAHARRGDMPRQGPALSYAVSDVDPQATSTGLVAEQTCAWLDALVAGGDQRPFAAWVSFPDPHTPYEVPRQWAASVPAESVELPPTQDADDPTLPERTRALRRILDVSGEPEANLREAIAVYHAQVRFVDDAVGRILERLEHHGLSSDTIVVFCADHGDFAGEHGMTRKGGAFYDCLVRVPLLISWPGRVPQGAVDDSPVNLLDIVPTVLSLQGLPLPEGAQGQLLPTVTPAPARDVTFSEYGAGGAFCTLADLAELPVAPHGLDASRATLRWREAEGRRKMVRSRSWKYVTDPQGDLDELYDLQADPHELTNLALEPQLAAVVADLRRRLFEWSVATEDSRPVSLPDPLPISLSTPLTAGGSSQGSSS